MTKLEYFEARSALINALGEFDPPYEYWLGGDDVDQGPSYCTQCAEKQVTAGNAQFVDGGWLTEHDGCCHCDTCGQLLDYTLTDHGVESEIYHFAENPPGTDSETIFHLLRLLEAAPDDAQVQSIICPVVNQLSRGAPQEQ